MCRITAYARLGKVKAEALAVMKDFTTKYGAVFEKSEPSDGPEGFQIAGRIPVSSKGLSVDNISKGLSFANICISGSGRGILTVDIEPQRLKGKVSSKLTDAEIAEIRKEELAQEQFMREYEREKEREEEKKNREEEEVLKKMKAFVVSKFEMRQSKTILDFIEFAVREKSGINFSFVSNKSKPRKVPTVDFSVESMTLFDVLEKMVKDGKVTYQLSGSIVILRVP